MVSKLVLFEIKKIIFKPINKIVLGVLAAILIIMCFLAINSITYVDAEGNTISGTLAAKNLRNDKNQWSGYITEDVLNKAISENAAMINSQEYLSDNIQQKNQAYAKTQGILDIREMINDAFTEYDEYEYNRIDSVTTELTSQLYENRITNLKKWLDTTEQNFSDNEKQFLMERYEKLKTPFYYEYKDGWETLVGLSYTPILMILIALVIGFLVSGIFSDEFQLKADSIFYSTKLGRNKAIRAKIEAGFLSVTVIYWVVILLYSVVVFSQLGMGGAGCPIQISNWKTFYNFTYVQEYLIIILGGYVGTLFVLTLSMLVSAITHSTVLTMTIPFVFTCVTPFLGRIPGLNQVLSLFPNELLQIGQTAEFNIMHQIGGKTLGSIPIIFALYLVLYAVLPPILYQVYGKTRIK